MAYDVVHVHVPTFLMRQIFVKLLPRPTTAPSGKVTSVTNAAASHFVIGWIGGTLVNVLKGVTLDVEIERVVVTAGPGVNVLAESVDMAFKVSAAEVYNAFKVSAGCGEPVENEPQAKIMPSATAITENLKKRADVMFASESTFP